MERLILVFVVAGLMFAASSSQANLTKGGFETDDLTGRTVVLPVGGSASVFTYYSDPISMATGTTNWSPTDSSYFTMLKTDGPGSMSKLYESFYASPGASLLFEYSLDSGQLSIHCRRYVYVVD